MSEVALSVVETVTGSLKSVIVDRIKRHVDYIWNYNENIQNAREKLEDLCCKKLDIDDAVRQGKEKGEKMKREAINWLKTVEMFTQMEELKTLMKDDIIANIAVKLMERHVLKTLMKKDKEILDIVVKMVKENNNKLEGRVDDGNEYNKVALKGEDYKRIGECVVQVMAETTEEFKKLMKEDIKMAVVAMELMVDEDLENLIKGDEEMAEVVRKVEAIGEQEIGLCDQVEEQELLAKKHEEEDKPVDKHTIKEVVKSKVKHLGELVMDQSFLKELPEGAQYGLKVMDALCKREGLMSNENSSSRQRCCGWCAVRFQNLRRQHHWSEAAEMIINQIDSIVKKHPGEQVMRPKRVDELEDIQTGFLKGLQSREEILQKVVQALKDDNVNAVGVYGMGGSGKTTLAKEVSKSGPKGMFHQIIMVEISKAANIERIQDDIADALNLPLGGTHGVHPRAMKLYDRLKPDNSQENKDGKNKKMLVILDNVWEKLDLNDLGISLEYCKLLITSREKHVCEVMDVQSRNTIQVGMLNKKEARDLFQYKIGKRVDKGEFKSLADRLLNTCGGLPLSIATTAYALKNKDITIWQNFAEELEKPISAQISGVHHKTYSVIKSSYDFMENKEKKLFFLLACLSPIGSSISIETLMRYGIGLSILQHVNKLSEAKKQVDTWVEELVSSSMLLEGDLKGEVKIHDVVRASAISFAAKASGHKFLVEAIPRWMKKEAFNDYTAISLLSQVFDRFPIRRGVYGDKLRIFLFQGSTFTNFPPYCFEGMVNLEVLTLKSIVVNTELSESIGTLTKLRTLDLEECELVDIKAIGLLVDLLVLSLRESTLEELPNEIGELSNLILLDLSGTNCKVSADIIRKLSELEGLYMLNSIITHPSLEMKSKNKVGGIVEADSDQVGTSDGEGRSTEYNRLPLPTYDEIMEMLEMEVPIPFESYLNALEMNILTPKELPINADFVSHLDYFILCVGIVDFVYDFQKRKYPFKRILSINEIDEICGILANSCLTALVKRADWLRLRSIDVEHLVPLLDEEGFKELRYLHVIDCENVTFIINKLEIIYIDDSLVAFPKLESLTLEYLPNLEMVCDEKAPLTTFFNLQCISLSHLASLQYLMPLALVSRNMTKIQLTDCKPLKYIFLENYNEDTYIFELPSLKSLKLRNMTCLIGFLGPKHPSSTASQEDRIFFNHKITFPSLERLKLHDCNKVTRIWSKELNFTGFRLLKKIRFYRCQQLLSVGPPSAMSTLEKLEILTIEDCENMVEVVTEEYEVRDQRIRFPQLKFLSLSGLCKLVKFCGESYKLEFPALRHLYLRDLEAMSSFTGLKSPSGLFEGKFDFPCLEEMLVVNVNEHVKGLWNGHQSIDEGRISKSNPLPMLHNLTISHCRFNPCLFTSSLASTEGSGIIGSPPQLPTLKQLSVDCCESLKGWFEEKFYIVDDVWKFYEELEILALSNVPSLNLIPLHLYKGLCDLRLLNISWEYAIKTNALVGSLQQLQYLVICSCDSMKFVIHDDGEVMDDVVIKLPQLKTLELVYLDSIISFTSTPNATLHLPSLETLQINNCDKLEHFWPGPVVAPRLKVVDLQYCKKMQYLLGNPNRALVLPSLQTVRIDGCHNMHSFSLSRLRAPKLTHIYYDEEITGDSYGINDLLRTKQGKYQQQDS